MGLTIKCKSCGNDNPMGDVFCRKCGAELDIDSIDPGKIKKKRHRGCFNTVMELLTLCLMLIFFAFCACVFISPADSTMPVLSNEEKKSVDAICGEINQATRGEIKTRTFDLKSILAGQVFKKLVLTAENFQEYEVKLEPMTDNYFKFYLKTKGKGLPFTITIICKVIEGELNDETHWPVSMKNTLEIIDTRIGLIPLTNKLAPFIKKTFFQFFEHESFANMRKYLDTLTVVPDKGFSIFIFRQGDRKKK